MSHFFRSKFEIHELIFGTTPLLQILLSKYLFSSFCVSFNVYAIYVYIIYSVFNALYVLFTSILSALLPLHSHNPYTEPYSCRF